MTSDSSVKRRLLSRRRSYSVRRRKVIRPRQKHSSKQQPRAGADRQGGSGDCGVGPCKSKTRNKSKIKDLRSARWAPVEYYTIRMTTPRRPTFPVPVRPIPLHSSSPSDHHHPPTSYKHPSSSSITSITAMLSARPMQPLPIAAPQSPALLSPNVPASPARPSPHSQHSYSQQPIPPSIQLQAPSPQPTPDPTPTVSAFQQAQQIPNTPQSSEQVSDCLIYTQRSHTHVLHPSRFLLMSRH